MELSVRDRGDRVRGLGLATDYLGCEVGQSHHSQDITADRRLCNVYYDCMSIDIKFDIMLVVWYGKGCV